MNACASNTDQQLLALIQKGDELAFTVLFERYRNKLYYYILRHTKSPEIAEEIVIDIFMKLWTGRELTAHIQEPSAFFHKVGYYKAMDFLRTTSRHSRLQQGYVGRMKLADEKSPDQLLIDEEAKQLLLKAVNQLPPQRKLIYKMSRELGHSHEEIAKVLNLSRSTVNNTIISASRSILEYIKKHARDQAAMSILLFFQIMV